MNLEIRKLTMDDAETTYQYSSDAENTRYMLKNPDVSIEETRDYIKKSIAEYGKEHPAYLAYAVVDRGKHIGEVFAFLEEDLADIGWIIHKRYWGRGYAVLAAKMLIERLRKDYQVEKIVAYCDRRNLASQSVMKKLGMTYAGDNGIREYDREQTPDYEWKYVLMPDREGWKTAK